MQILYYVWNEFTGEDCRMVMRELGEDVIEFRCPWNKLDEDENFENALEAAILTKKNGKKIDLVFTWNFFPIISRVCHRQKVRYVSWVFDSPHFPLASKEVENNENSIWLFDKDLCKEYMAKNIKTIHYSPLGINAKRLKDISDKLFDGGIVYEHDVTFLGNLYDNEFNFYDFAASHMPDELKGIIEGTIAMQRHTYDVDFIGNEQVLSKDIINQMAKYMRFELGGNYNFDRDTLIRDILKKKCTKDERKMILEDLGQRFKVDMYTKAKGPTLEHVYDLGQADYMVKMPHVFCTSKINLNLSMRSIRTGLSLRIMDVLGAGGFLVTTWQEELDDYFVDGQDLVVAHTPEEIGELIEYYLNHEDERKQIALNGQTKACRYFDYRNLLPFILNANNS